MSKIEKLEDFYKSKLGWIPDDFHSQIGHFNVFEIPDFTVEKATTPTPYKRRDYFKVMLSLGQSKLIYADREIEIQKQALVFSNPHIPYKCESLTKVHGGFFCIFNHDFFRQFGDINQYNVFHPQGNHVFELEDEQVKKVAATFQQMFTEINSNYVYKYDLLKALTFELIHFGMKLEPDFQTQPRLNNAAQRITSMFLELLERQFPIDENHAKVSFRSAAEFAKQLNVHVNHLNRAVRETTQKTTSQLIAERILHEAKILLKQSEWNISEIAFALGFAEITHFSNFFKKHTQISPSKFRLAM
jgi:AraC family transcriptional regulator, transcriptional activator of pobA